jgi:hypothetical protein
MKEERKCQCCGEDAGYIGPNGYLCFACAATIASIHENYLVNQAVSRGEDVKPVQYNLAACLEACDIKPIDAEESNDENGTI